MTTKLIKNKVIIILSNGSLNLSFIYFSNFKQLLINEKDNKNFNLNKKQNNFKTQVEEFSNYKKKYLV